MHSLKLNTSYKYHFVIALIISLWLVAFLVLIAPFDIAELSLKNRLVLMPGYGIISFATYILMVPLQNRIFQNYKKWTLLLESLFMLVFSAIALIGSYGYYKSGFINGLYSFADFTLTVYYPIFFVLLSIVIIARWFLNNKISTGRDKKIVLSGDNKRDILQISSSDLVSISSADNYVEVHYLENGVLSKKLLRNTLKNIQQEAPGLIKIHRSHLINPAHFKAWKDQNTIVLNQIELPVSKTYRTSLLNTDFSSLKTPHPPQMS